MSAKPGRTGHRHTREARERIARGVRRELSVRRRRWAVTAPELRAVERGEVDALPSLRPHVLAAGDVSAAVAEALGGLDGLSPQRRALLTSATRLGVFESALAAHLLATADWELLPKLVAVVRERRALLETLGLDWKREERSLEDYLRERAAAPNRARTTIDAEAVREPAPAEDARSCADDARERGAEEPKS